VKQECPLAVVNWRNEEINTTRFSVAA